MVECIMLSAIVLACFVGLISTQEPDSEHVCTSRFDYESKMLKRIVTVEYTIHQIEETVRDETERLLREKNAMKEKVAELEQKLKDQLEPKLQELEQISGTLKEEQKTELLHFDQMSQELRGELMVKFADFKVLNSDCWSFARTNLQDVKRTSWTLKENQANYLKGVKQATMFYEERMNRSITELEESELKIQPPVAFYLRDPHTTSPGPNTLLRFTVPLLGNDSVYDIDTGYFTAPTDGVYLFVAQVCSVANKQIQFQISVNDGYISQTTLHGSDSDSQCASTPAVANLRTAETVSLWTGENTSEGETLTSVAYRWSTFLGVLIQPL